MIFITKLRSMIKYLVICVSLMMVNILWNLHKVKEPKWYKKSLETSEIIKLLY